MSKKTVFFIFLGLIIGSFVFVGIGVNASSEYVEVENYGATLVSTDGVYTLEEMLTYAIQDEYLAQATYHAIIEAYGDVKPFSRIVLAEQTHIDLLLPLFETYGIEVPVNDAAQYVVLPDSISSALATGVEAETANIALYETFLAQTDLPDDVRAVFESLQTASEHHLKAFSRDRLLGAGYDLGQMIKNQFKKGSGQGNKGSNNQGQSNQGFCLN
ncbi:MAG: hypothetical protein CVV62_02085 [Tenericutes bacterium HGW-Tenericutes-7]|nr:MAG: hypothetical protein CVV62_02085 [Tenericutes bacterium HGW-Tenericutes-7]